MADYDIFHSYRILDRYQILDEGKYSLTKCNVYNLPTRREHFVLLGYLKHLE